MIEPEDRAPIVEVERPEGLMKVTFVAEDELVVGSERYTVNRVDYRVMVRFKRHGVTWDDARDTWIRRAQFQLGRRWSDEYPSDSARKKIWAAVEQVRDEVLASNPDICERARVARLRQEIRHEQHKLHEIEAKGAELRRGLEQLQAELRQALASLPTSPLDPEQWLGCGKLSVGQTEIEAAECQARGKPVPTADIDTSWYDDIADEIEASVQR